MRGRVLGWTGLVFALGEPGRWVGAMGRQGPVVRPESGIMGAGARADPKAWIGGPEPKWDPNLDYGCGA